MNEVVSSVSIKDKKKLEKNISKLSDSEYNQILQIIIKNNQKFSENTGGIFFNLKYINSKTISEINNYVDKILNQKKILLDNESIDSVKKPINKEVVYEEHDKYTLKKEEIKNELERLQNKNNENFVFQNFLDKLSLTNIKSFKKNEKIVYPTINNTKKKFNGVNERLLKKCREVNKINDNHGIKFDIEMDNNNMEETNIGDFFKKQILIKNNKIEEEDEEEEEYLDDDEEDEEEEEIPDDDDDESI